MKKSLILIALSAIIGLSPITASAFMPGHGTYGTALAGDITSNAPDTGVSTGAGVTASPTATAQPACHEALNKAAVKGMTCSQASKGGGYLCWAGGKAAKCDMGSASACETSCKSCAEAMKDAVLKGMDCAKAPKGGAYLCWSGDNAVRCDMTSAPACEKECR